MDSFFKGGSYWFIEELFILLFFLMIFDMINANTISNP